VNCSEVQQRLSAYHDGELSPDVAAEVAAHLTVCSPCAAELASFSKLSHMSRRLTDPPVPTHMWEELEAKLRGEKTRTAMLRQILPTRTSGRLFAIAATILIAAGIGVVTYQAWFAGAGHDHSHEHLADNFADYLDAFENRPDDAQQILLVNYEGRPTTLLEASAVLGYEPVAAKGLPAGCSLETVYLLNMPCCTCAQVVCRNKEGRSIVIFEHDFDQPVWFGDRPTVKSLCHDVPTSVVQVGDELAATWKDGPRYITIIGASNLEEVADFVAHFESSVFGKG
jgi:hypothetical protein